MKRLQVLIIIIFASATVHAAIVDDSLVSKIPAGTIISLKNNVDLKSCVGKPDPTMAEMPWGYLPTTLYFSDGKLSCDKPTFGSSLEFELDVRDLTAFRNQKFTVGNFKCVVESVSIPDGHPENTRIFFETPEFAGTCPLSFLTTHRATFDPRTSSLSLSTLKSNLGSSFGVYLPNKDLSKKVQVSNTLSNKTGKAAHTETLNEYEARSLKGQ